MRMRNQAMCMVMAGLVGVTTRAAAQRSAPPRLSPALVDYLTGAWSCEGAFANGKPIASDLRFTPVLQGKWLRYTHTDRAPNTFQAQAMWGIDAPTANFVALMADNFGGARLFRSTGWHDGTIVLESAPLLPDSPTGRHERFTYRSESPDRMRMQYEASGDGQNWRLGDSLVCERKR